MQCTYVFKSSLIQKASANTAESVVDSSSLSATLLWYVFRANVLQLNNTRMSGDLLLGVGNMQRKQQKIYFVYNMGMLKHFPL